ncbi:MAG: hypothetical protein ACOCP4_02775 [Candidatus Woesearchaeota archaeon]
MGRYIHIEDTIGRTLLTIKVGGNPNSFGSFLESNIPLNLGTYIDVSLENFINYTFADIEENIKIASREIALNLIKREFYNSEINDQIELYNEYTELKGMLKAIIELFKTHGNVLRFYYG